MRQQLIFVLENLIRNQKERSALAVTISDCATQANKFDTQTLGPGILGECCLLRGIELGSLAPLMLVEQLPRVLGNTRISPTVCMRQYIPHWGILKAPEKLLSIWIASGRSSYRTLPGRAQASPISSRPFATASSSGPSSTIRPTSRAASA